MLEEKTMVEQKDQLGNYLKNKAQQHKLFIPYLTFGYPSVSVFSRLIEICQEVGVDALEVGIPHSDPVADGPVIQSSSQNALAQGVNPRLVQEQLTEMPVDFPLVAMTYGNIVFQYGFSHFAEDYRKAGFGGLIVADFPVEADSFLDQARAYLSVILLASVTTSPSRLAEIAQKSQGFVYLVSGRGVTGNTQAEEEDLKKAVALIKSHTDLPVLIGFGINTPSKAKKVAQLADGVIVGSALIQVLEEKEKEKEEIITQAFRQELLAYREALSYK